MVAQANQLPQQVLHVAGLEPVSRRGSFAAGDNPVSAQAESLVVPGAERT
jgi:hypothetical protein